MITACSGVKFTSSGRDADGQVGASGATIAGGRSGHGGTRGTEAEGGAGGDAGAPDPTTNGEPDALCYSSSCTSIGYSRVLLNADVMLDVSNSPITVTTGAIPHLAIGAANDYVTPWTNCAGWPQAPDYVGVDFYPKYVRVWIR